MKNEQEIIIEQLQKTIEVNEKRDKVDEERISSLETENEKKIMIIKNLTINLE